MPYRCGKMMYTDSGYSRLAWDRLMEALIDPENREACGRIVIEPGTDVKQSRKNRCGGATRSNLHCMNRNTTVYIVLLYGVGRESCCMQGLTRQHALKG